VSPPKDKQRRRNTMLYNWWFEFWNKRKQTLLIWWNLYPKKSRPKYIDKVL
jgi:hypothetical protein